MKKIVFLFFIILCILLNACSKDNDITNVTSDKTNEFSGNDNQMFINYGIDTTNLKVKCYYYISSDTIEFSGIKDGYLWFANYNMNLKQKLNEWKDVQKTDISLNIYDGYGKYSIFNIKRIYPFFYKKTEKGSIVNVSLINDNGDSTINQCFFIVNNVSTFRTSLDINIFYHLYDWYGYNVRMYKKRDADIEASQTIYSEKGDSLFSLSKNVDVETLISINEYINAIPNGSSINVERCNLLSNDIVWSKSISLGFTIYDNTKKSYTIQKSDNIWTYNYIFLFYDGTEKKFSFSIDVSAGTYTVI